MTNERLQELIELFCDADRRNSLTETARETYCPTVEGALEAMAQ